MIDIGRRRRPGVVEIVDALHAKAAGHLFIRRNAPAQIFEFHLLETDFARASDVQRHGAVPRDVLVGLAVGASAFRSVVDPDAQVVGVEDDFERIPLVRPVGIGRTRVGRVRRQTARTEASSSAGPRRRLGPRPPARPAAFGRRREEPDRAEPRLERLALDLAALRIEFQREGSRGVLAVGQRHVDPLDSLRRRLRAQHHARPTARGAAKCRRELHVLQRLVENQPAALGCLGRAHDFAVLRAPIGVAERARRPQRRSLESPVRHEVLVRPGARQHQAHRAYRRRDAAPDPFPHDPSFLPSRLVMPSLRQRKRHIALLARRRVHSAWGHPGAGRKARAAHQRKENVLPAVHLVHRRNAHRAVGHIARVHHLARSSYPARTASTGYPQTAPARRPSPRTRSSASRSRAVCRLDRPAACRHTASAT